ncbi:DUF916 domain-containing protein [Micromonospora sp. NBC_01699]|uniref:hypothetical protein n=1 Tax=Micromonospora sp. NBC_01699 TaxID=2975984 RepID=UPI002E2AB930|nr:hypothetical protein [Micromonospora sp. NBC_01699]
MLAAVAVLTVTVPVPPAGAVSRAPNGDDEDGRISIRLLDIPAARVQDPRARTYIIDHLKPGATINRRIEVRNSSSEQRKIELYAAGASIEESVFVGADGRTANELSDWIGVEVPSVDLAPNSKKLVRVTITVPETASAGERYAAVWAQVTRPPSDDSNVGQIRRVGVRVYLDIGTGGEPATDFRVDGLAFGPPAGQWPVVTAEVHNTGGRALDMAGTLTLAHSSGTLRAGPFDVASGVSILPGQSGQVHVVLDQPLPDGRWDARLVLLSGTVERVTEATLTLPAPVGAIVAEPDGRSAPVLAIGAGLLLAVVVVAFLAYLVRRNRATRAGAGAA